MQPHIVTGETEKFAAFRRSNVALAASGTVTLELALSGVPMVGVYRVERLAALLRPFIKIEAPHILLPNLILGEGAIPELVARDAEPRRIADRLAPLLSVSSERAAQVDKLRKLDELMRVPEQPSDLAAGIVLDQARRGRG